MRLQMHYSPFGERFSHSEAIFTMRTSSWALILALTLVAGPAWAYIDPGTGSMLVQSVLATIAVIMVAGRTFWTRLKSFFSRHKDGQADREG